MINAKTSVVVISGCIVCALLAWVVFHFITFPRLQEVVELHFDKNIQADVRILGTVSFDGLALQRSRYRFDMTFEAVPQGHPDGMAYKCLFKYWEVYNDTSEMLVLRYDRVSAQRVEYSVDPQLSEQERLDIYKAFRIDPYNVEVTDDDSLFKQPFYLSINRKGQIAEIALSPDLRNALEKLWKGSSRAPLFQEFFSSSPNFPPLFIDTVAIDLKNNQSWVSEGKIIENFSLFHQVASHEGGVVRMKSRSLKGNTQNWELEWTFNQAKHSIPDLHITLTYSTLEGPFRREVSHYVLSAEIMITTRDKERSIKELEI